MIEAVDWLARLDGWLGAFCLMALCALMISGIVVRTLATIVDWLPKDIPVAWEYSSYLMAVTFTFGAALTLRAGGHIRVKLLVTKAPPAISHALELAAACVGLAFAGFFLYAMGNFAWRSYVTDERSIASNTQLWIPQVVVAVGALLLLLQFVARVGQILMGETPENRDVIR